MAIDALRHDVAKAFHQYREFLDQPGRWLYLPPGYLPVWHVVEARDQLEWALRALPPRPRRELRRVVARLDHEFERRTLPDPDARVVYWCGRDAWWWRRLTE